MAFQNGATPGPGQLPFLGFQPGLPANLLQVAFSGQDGEKSANCEGSPHYNDQLLYRADGSDLHMHGMDFAVDNSPEVTFGRYEIGDRGVRRNVAETTWRSSDGRHTIRQVHKAFVDPQIEAAQKACCEGCYPYVPLCFSHNVCPGCFVTKTEGIKYTTMVAETFDFLYDGQAVGRVEVKPALTRGSGTEQHLIKQTVAYDAANHPVWVLNDGEALTNTSATRHLQEYHCCTGICEGQCDAFTPLCCPRCLPLGLSCLASCFTPKCNQRCDGCCCTCCLCLLACCKASDRSAVVTAPTSGWYRFMPVDGAQKVRRVLYPLQRGNGEGHGVNGNGYAEQPVGWIAYTFAGVEGVPSCASFTRPEGPADMKDLLALPLLIDVSMGTEQKPRETWSFNGSQRFPPVEVVNYWPKPQVLHNVVVNMNKGTFHNVTYGGDAKIVQQPVMAQIVGTPVQQSMGPAPIVAEVVNGHGDGARPTEVEPEVMGVSDS